MPLVRRRMLKLSHNILSFSCNWRFYTWSRMFLGYILYCILLIWLLNSTFLHGGGECKLTFYHLSHFWCFCASFILVLIGCFAPRRPSCSYILIQNGALFACCKFNNISWMKTKSNGDHVETIARKRRIYNKMEITSAKIFLYPL